jgi:GNAT superfamily N-acetyltransferase
MTGINIRKAVPADILAILRLYADSGMAGGGQEPGDAAAQIAATQKALAKIATYPQYAVYVATIANAVVGTFALLVMDNLAHNGAPSAIVEDVCVDPQQRRAGIGRAMMAFALNVARDHACYKLCLSSNAARADAHGFYRSLGFEQHGFSFVVPIAR